MNVNYHIFVCISTIIVYVLINSKKDNDQNHNYLYVPLILYGGHYFFYPENSLKINSDINVPIQTDFEELLVEPFPASTSASF
jgi:hypothetical protein